jgi:periplasmic divalent cation tolerance protein
MFASASGFLVVLCTCSSMEEGLRVARLLVEGRLAACANIVPGVESVYRWQGAVETAQEALLVIKTTAAAFPVLRERILETHGYEVPEVLAIPVVEGSAGYLQWLGEQVGGE